MWLFLAQLHFWVVEKILPGSREVFLLAEDMLIVADTYDYEVRHTQNAPPVKFSACLHVVHVVEKHTYVYVNFQHAFLWYMS